MTRRSAAPFHQLSDDAVRAGAWFHDLNETGRAPVEALLPNWDYGATLRLDRTFGVDWSRAADDLSLGDAFDLELMVEVGSGRGSLPREAVMVERVLLAHGCGDQHVEIAAPSRLLSHQLVLRSSIALARTGRALDRLAPQELGSRLWSERLTTRLEGDDPRLPMEVVDFGQHFAGRPQRHAPWFVNWSPAAAHRDFRGALRLYLNAEQSEVLDRVQAQDPLVLQAIMSDVVSQVCEGLLRDVEHEASLQEVEDGTLADQARHWLERAFGGLDEARSVLSQRPGEFRAAILASVRL